MAITRLRYRRQAFVGNLILLAIALIFLNAFFDLAFFKDVAVTLVAAAVSGVLLLVLGISPFLTDHYLTSDELELRQGWYFRAMIPVSNIERIQVVERGPVRTGVFFLISGDALYVTSQRNDLILVSLKRAQRFGFALGKKSRHVYFDTLDKGALLGRLPEKALTPASPGRPS